MKQRILFLVAFFLFSHCAYSQHIADVMPVEIPLNTTKESAVKKLLNNGFQLRDSWEEDGFKVLEYERTVTNYDAYYGYYPSSRAVWLYCKNGIVSKQSWKCLLREHDIMNELRSVYDLEPYEEQHYKDDSGFPCNLFYFHWKGCTMVVADVRLVILSNDDAKKMIKKTSGTTAQEVNEPQCVDDKVYGVVEVMPEYPGGKDGLAKYLSRNIKYPEEAKDKGINGRVFVKFIVEKDGSVNEVSVMKSVDPLVDNEAIRVVRGMPKWKPGKQKGKIVRVSYILPINFQPKN